jgi:hypothetical protein
MLRILTSNTTAASLMATLTNMQISLQRTMHDSTIIDVLYPMSIGLTPTSSRRRHRTAFPKIVPGQYSYFHDTSLGTYWQRLARSLRKLIGLSIATMGREQTSNAYPELGHSGQTSNMTMGQPLQNPRASYSRRRSDISSPSLSPIRYSGYGDGRPMAITPPESRFEDAGMRDRYVN